ncbi:MAG: TIGR03086 family metal-binding protein [Nocardioides sp.]|uniref:TIGR03086 family metal-binding protein n=1 Tax=Nocardioides sp. TaxID=35761 RepID=UPI0039E57395
MNGTDPRWIFDDVTAWVADLIDTLSDADWARPTPCDRFDVETLARHLVAVLDRTAVVFSGGDPTPLPRLAEGVATADLARAFRDRIPVTRATMTDTALTGTVVVPPGITVPGAVGVLRQSGEIAVHGWDLATARGASGGEPEEAAVAILAVADQIVPAGPDFRDDPQIPFERAVTPADDAAALERLANHYGRRSRPPVLTAGASS